MNDHRNTRQSLLWVALSVLFVTGCQTAVGGLQSSKLAPPEFGTTWSDYTSCRKSRDVPELLKMANRLRDAVGPVSQLPQSSPDDRFVTQVRALFQPNRPRLAADPSTMALDCWLHTAEVAKTQGQDDLAYQMYSRVLQAPKSQEFSYYIRLAQTNLDKLHVELRAAARASASPAN